MVDTLNKINLNYVVEGSGKPLVFIHGLSDNLMYWDFLANYLKDDFQVIRFDLRGHGDSQLGDEEITIDTYVEDINRLLEELKISDANLIGFSLGGAIAQQFTITYPNKVNSLVLMSTFYKLDQHSFNILTQFKEKLSEGFGEFFDYILPLILCPDVIEANKEELMILKQMALQNANVDAYIKAVNASLNFNIENEISEIDVPTLILTGKYDDVFLPESQKDLKNQIENSELIVMDNVKHNILVDENNEKVMKILENFFG